MEVKCMEMKSRNGLKTELDIFIEDQLWLLNCMFQK